MLPGFEFGHTPLTSSSVTREEVDVKAVNTATPLLELFATMGVIV